MTKTIPIILCIILIPCVFLALPFIPPELCVGTNYSAYPVSMGYNDYFSFLVSCFIPENTAPVSAAVFADDNSVISELQLKDNIHITETPLSEIALTNETTYNIDLSELLKTYSPQKKEDEKPQILIIHTHATESFAGTSGRSLDKNQNMIEVGRVFKESLTKRGFSVIHDTTYHDYPNYNGSYANSLKTVEEYLKKYPSVNIVFDLHRDGVIDQNGSAVKLSANYNGQSVAKLMFVVGTDAGGLTHPNWKSNLCFATSLQSRLNSICNGLMRPINVRNERFNHHTTPSSVIVECGTNGNTLEEACRSVQLLALALSDYIK